MGFREWEANRTRFGCHGHALVGGCVRDVFLLLEVLDESHLPIAKIARSVISRFC